MTFSPSSLSLVASSATSTSSILSQVLQISRGGGVGIVTATAATTSIEWLHKRQLLLRGGGKTKTASPITSTSTNSSPSKKILNITPEGLSALNMAIAMSLHYLAYNIARPTTIALFTSAKTGFAGNHAAFPLAMAFISPASLMLLFLYGKILGRGGPRIAQRQTTLICSSLLASISLVIHVLSSLKEPLKLVNIPVLQSLVGLLFIFRESYVQLLSSQYWSFMSSVLTPDQSAKWFSRISGLTSITSALSGLVVSTLADKLGLPGALGVAACILTSSLIFSEKAYAVSETYGFNPANEDNKESQDAKTKIMKTSKHDENMVQKASILFQRVPVLKALFREILIGQGLATLLNVCFVTKLSQSIPDDSYRAGWMGKFFSGINIVACFLQFVILPQIMPFLEPKVLWRFMPIAMLSGTLFLCIDKNPSLYLISGTFMLWKVLEFSFRRMLDEMVYVPLDFESRFVGKEIISVFGYRFGKSGMSLILSGITSTFGNMGLQQLACLTTGVAGAWLLAAFSVSNLVLTKAEAEQAYQKHKAARGAKSANK